MKVLYAAGNRVGSHLQLKRFLSSIRNKKIDLKIAAYKNSMGDLNVDYTLDSLLNFTNPDAFSFNGNFMYYFNEIKRFSPDLIISDIDIHTSIIALESKIKLWQVSPILIYNALPNSIKYNLNIHKNHAHLINSNFRKKEYINYVLNNSDRKFVISHLCDVGSNVRLNKGFEWARPEFVLSDETKRDIDFLGMMSRINLNIMNNINYKGNVVYSYNPLSDNYNNIIMKNIYNDSDYIKDLGNCKVVLSEGHEVFAADTFYNQKFTMFNVVHDDLESVIMSKVNEHFGSGKIISDSLNVDKLVPAPIILNESVKFLHEQL